MKPHQMAHAQTTKETRVPTNSPHTLSPVQLPVPPLFEVFPRPRRLASSELKQNAKGIFQNKKGVRSHRNVCPPSLRLAHNHLASSLRVIAMGRAIPYMTRASSWFARNNKSSVGQHTDQLGRTPQCLNPASAQWARGRSRYVHCTRVPLFYYVEPFLRSQIQEGQTDHSFSEYDSHKDSRCSQEL